MTLNQKRVVEDIIKNNESQDISSYLSYSKDIELGNEIEICINNAKDLFIKYEIKHFINDIKYIINHIFLFLNVNSLDKFNHNLNNNTPDVANLLYNCIVLLIDTNLASGSWPSTNLKTRIINNL